MIKVGIIRGEQLESIHHIKVSVINSKGKSLFSSGNNKDLTYPRSAMKIFQSIPLVISGAAEHYNLNDKQLAISSSSHFGESNHIKILENWIKKISINQKYLQCGIHNPLNLNSSNNLLFSRKKPQLIHNNCSGKHLGMLTTCKFKKYNLKNYTHFNHPIQKSILNILENFFEFKSKQKLKAIDGCSAPQYAFPLENLALGMMKISIFDKLRFDLAYSINKLLYCISNNPYYIGGTGRFDSDLIKITKGRIFCKIGAEGVLMFADLKNKFGGILKVNDGNQRAIPSATINLLKKLKSLNTNELAKLKKWNPEILYNHSSKKIGKIFTYKF